MSSFSESDSFGSVTLMSSCGLRLLLPFAEVGADLIGLTIFFAVGFWVYRFSDWTSTDSSLGLTFLSLDG